MVLIGEVIRLVGSMVKVMVFPEFLIKLITCGCERLYRGRWLIAITQSPGCNLPHRSAGLSGKILPKNVNPALKCLVIRLFTNISMSHRDNSTTKIFAIQFC